MPSHWIVGQGESIWCFSLLWMVPPHCGKSDTFHKKGERKKKKVSTQLWSQEVISCLKMFYLHKIPLSINNEMHWEAAQCFIAESSDKMSCYAWEEASRFWISGPCEKTSHLAIKCMDACGIHSAVPSASPTPRLLADGWPAMTHSCTYRKDTEIADGPNPICFHVHYHAQIRTNYCFQKKPNY